MSLALAIKTLLAQIAVRALEDSCEQPQLIFFAQRHGRVETLSGREGSKLPPNRQLSSAKGHGSIVILAVGTAGILPAAAAPRGGPAHRATQINAEALTGLSLAGAFLCRRL